MSDPYNNTPTTLVYIAGPYTSGDPWQLQRNIDQANDWAKKVAHESVMDRNMPYRQGHLFFPVIPHNNTPAIWGRVMPGSYFYDGTLKLMEACTVAVFFPPHPGVRVHSPGTEKEYSHARAKNMFVIDLRDDPKPEEKLARNLRSHLLFEYLDREENYWD